MKKNFFTVNKESERAVLKLNVHKLDAQIASKLKAEFVLLCRSPIKDLVIDMSMVDSCDSSGLSALLVAERQMRQLNGTTHLVVPNNEVRNLFSITQLDKVFFIHSSLDKIKK
ncbi:MAG: STAS domain-containing protein [Candidatus Kryptoniota bacterium]